jgi:hypothetical protein
MNRPLSYAEKARIYDKFLIARSRDKTTPLDKRYSLTLSDFRNEMARYARGEPIEIPPPAKWPQSGHRRWTPDEIAAARKDPKRFREYRIFLDSIRRLVIREAIYGDTDDAGSDPGIKEGAQMNNEKSEPNNGLPKPQLNMWGRLLEQSMREADPQRYEFKKEQGYLMPYLIAGQQVLEQMYLARIKEGEDPESAKESVVEDYAEQMMEEEMSEEDAEMIVSEWLGSQPE